MTTRRIFFIIIPAILVLGGVFYTVLGGFKKPEIKFAEAPAYLVLGKRFKGNIEDKKLKETYRDAHEKYKEGELKGLFCVLHFNEPDEQGGKIDAVIGVIVKDSSTSLPKGYKYYYWEKRSVVQATITSDYSVAPSASTVREAMSALALKEGYALDKTSFEKYYDRDHIVVQVPVFKK